MDPALYKLLMLLALLKPATKSAAALSGLQSAYLMIAKRRADWMCRADGSSKNLEMKNMIEKLSFCMAEMDRLSEILLFILNKQ
jgi:hypothetical protein